MNCRRCGSSRVILQGRCVKCKDCGGVSSKIIRRTIVPAEDRPLCPECMSPNPYGYGTREGIRQWVCRSCGKYYSSSHKICKVETSTMEVQVE